MRSGILRPDELRLMRVGMVITNGGGGGSTSSQSDQQTTTNNTDRRIVNDGGFVASDGSFMNYAPSFEDNKAYQYTDASTFETNNSYSDSRATSNSYSDSRNFQTNNTDSSTKNYQMIDAGAVKSAFDFATNADAIQGDGLNRLLGVASSLSADTQKNALSLAAMAERMATESAASSSSMSSRFQDNVMQAYSNGIADKEGGIDQRTMIVLGVAAAGAIVLMNRGK